MSSGLLSLKWNNHKSTFFHVLSTIRSKESYCDVTLACDGRFYSLHKFVLSTCSEYFEEMFERTQCKHPVIVLKDINSEDLEALLNYMYVGEVNVVQEKLAGLIKAAECLKIKGLAVPDEDPMESKDNSSIDRERHKRSQRGEDSPRAKRRRRENSSDVSEEILSPVRSRPSARNREYHSSQNSKSAPVAPSEENEEGSREIHGLTDASEEAENSSINANRQTDSSSNKNNSSQSSSHKKEVVPEEVTLDDEHVKSEPLDLDNEDTGEGDQDNKDGLHHDLGFDASDTMGGADDDGNYVDVDPSMLGGGQPQSVEDVVAQAMPGSSGFQGNSFPLWEGDGSLSGFPSEGFSGDSSQARQMETSALSASSSCSAPRPSQPHHLNQGTAVPSSPTSISARASAVASSLSASLEETSPLVHEHHRALKHLQQKGIDERRQVRSEASRVLHPIDTLGQRLSFSEGGGCDGLTNAAAAAAAASLPSLYRVIRHPSGECYRQCVLCSYSAPTSSRMLDHIKSHTGEKPFICPHPKCCKTFTRKFSLHAHLRLHTGEKPFICPICSRCFSTNSILTCHIRTHTGEKPYACPHCSYRSTQRTALKVHLRNAHADFTF